MRLVKDRDWKSFCARLTEHMRGAQITLEHQQRDRSGLPQNKRLEGTLEAVELSTNDACIDTILFRFSGGEARDHTLLEPLRIWVEEAGKGGGFNTMVVEAESGKTTLRLHPVVRAEWLEGLAIA